MIQSLFRGSKSLSLMLCGLYIYYISQLMHDYIFTEAKMFTRFFALLGASLFIYGLLIVRKTYKSCDEIMRVVYKVLLIICALNILVGIISLLSQNRAIEILASNLIWMFIMFFIVLLPFEEEDVCHVIRWSLLYVITSILFSFLFLKDLYVNPAELFATMTGWQAEVVNKPQEPAYMLIPIAAFMILYHFITRGWKTIIAFAFLLAFTAGLMGGRRTATAILFGLMVLPFLVSGMNHMKRLLGYFLILIISISSFFFIVPSNKSEVFVDSYFSVLAGRATTNTRSEAEDDFYEDFTNPVDWLIGRGAAGTFYSPALSWIDKLNRDIIETGYLNIILHAGLIMLIPYLILLVYAFYCGFFKSNSLFLKGCAAYVIFHLFMLYPGGHIRLSLQFFILFMFIRLCISEKWRNRTDDDIKRIAIDVWGNK